MDLPLWIEFFDDLQHVRGRSLNTVAAYRRDLELFLEFKKNNETKAHSQLVVVDKLVVHRITRTQSYC